MNDYAQAIGETTAAILVVNPGSFTISGAAGSATLEELVALGQRRQIPVIHDLAGGTLVDFQPFGLPRQPLVGDSIKAGADIVLLSGDKLLGGPQCGIILGRKAGSRRSSVTLWPGRLPRTD